MPAGSCCSRARDHDPVGRRASASPDGFVYIRYGSHDATRLHRALRRVTRITFARSALKALPVAALIELEGEVFANAAPLLVAPRRQPAGSTARHQELVHESQPID